MGCNYRLMQKDGQLSDVLDRNGNSSTLFREILADPALGREEADRALGLYDFLTNKNYFQEYFNEHGREPSLDEARNILLALYNKDISLNSSNLLNDSQGIRVGKLTERLQSDVISSLLGTIINELEPGQRYSFKDIMERHRSDFAKMLSEYNAVSTSGGLTDKAKAMVRMRKGILTEILENWDVFSKIVGDQFAAIQGVDVKYINSVASQIEETLGSNNERVSFSDDFSFTIDFAKTLSPSLRRFFKGIKLVGRDGKAMKNSLGLDRYDSFDVIYNTLMSWLADTKPSFSAMMNRLIEIEESMKHTNEAAWLPVIIQRLKEADTQRQDEFTTAMAVAKLNMKFSLFKQSYGDTETASVQSNSHEKATSLKTRWQEQILYGGFYTLEGDGFHFNPYHIDVVRKKLDNVKNLQASNQSIDAAMALDVMLREDFGIDLSKAYLYKLVNKSAKLKKGYKVENVGIDDFIKEIVEPLLETAANISETEKKNKEALEKDGESANIVSTRTLFSAGDFNNQSTRVLNLAKEDSKFRLDVTSSSFQSGKKTLSSYRRYDFLHMQMVEIKEGPGNRLFDLLRNEDYFSKTSYLLELIEKFPDLMKREFNIATVDIARSLVDPSQRKYGDTPFSSLSEPEHEMFKVIQFFASQGNIGNYRKVTMMDLTHSDKETAFMMETVARFFNDKASILQLSSSLKSAAIPKSVVRAIFNEVVMPEITRIATKGKNESEREEGSDRYSDIGSELFFSIPELNFIKVGDLSLAEFVKKHLDPSVATDSLLIDAGYGEQINKAITSHMLSMIEETKSFWLENGVMKILESDNKKLSLRGLDKHALKRYMDALGLKATSDNYNTIIEIAAADFAINNFIHNFNISQLFTTDVANFSTKKENKSLISLLNNLNESNQALDVTSPEYKAAVIQSLKETFTNYGKRLAAEIAPGLVGNLDRSRDYRVLAVNFPGNSASKEIQRYVDLLGSKMGYDSIDYTDAQEWVTLYHFLHNKFIKGKIDSDTWKRISEKFENGKLKEGEDISFEEYGITLTPAKDVQVANILNPREARKQHKRVYIKSSAMPLIPSLVKGSPLEDLLNLMHEFGIDRVAASSAIKVGGVKGLNLTDSNGNMRDINELREELKNDQKELSPEVLAKTESDYIIEIPGDSIKEQLEVPFDEEKDSINVGTQGIKLLFADLVNINEDIFLLDGANVNAETLRQEFANRFGVYYKMQYESLARELEYDQKTGVINMEKLQNLLANEASNRNYDYASKLGIAFFKDGRWQIPLSILPASDKIEALLSSIVDNRVRKLKMHGGSGVLGSEFGFTRKPNIVTEGEYKGTVIHTQNYNEKTGLMPHKFDGKTSRGSQIFVKWDFRDNNGNLLDINDFIGEDGRIDTNKLPAELLERIGFRIPTQGHNSMVPLEIAGFLPTGTDLLVASRDLVKQMGSDFDVDKLFYYSHNYVYNNGKLSKIKYVDLNKINFSKIYSSIANLKERIDKAERFENVDINEAIAKLKEDAYLLAASVDPIDKEQARIMREEIGELKALQKTDDIENIQNLKNRVSYLEKILTKKAYVQNGIIDIFQSVLTNPNEQVQRQIATPLSEGNMQELSNDLDSRYSGISQGGQFSGFSANYQRSKYVNATAGKAGVGAFSLDSTFHASLQNKKVGLRMFAGGTEMGFEWKIGDQVFDSNEHFLGSVYELDNGSGNRISENISYFQSVSVDNEKLQILDKINVNNDTFHAIKTMLLAGFSPETIVYFINQPIIKEFIKNKKYRTSVVSDSRASRQAIIDDFILAFSESNKVDQSIAEDFNESEEYRHSLQDLKDMIDEYVANNGSFESNQTMAKKQLAILGQFLQLTDVGAGIQTAQSAINTDSAGIGSSFPYIAAKRIQLNGLYNHPFLSNAESLLGEVSLEIEYKGDVTEDGKFLLGKVVVKNESYYQYIKPTTIQGFASTYATVIADNIFNKQSRSDMFMYNSSGFNAFESVVIDVAKNVNLDTINSRAEFTGKLMDFYKSQLLANREVLAYMLEFDTNTNRLETVDVARKRTIAQIAYELPILKNKYRNNKFLQRLTIHVAENNKDMTIEFDLSAKEGMDELDLYASFDELVNRENQFGRNLILMSMLGGYSKRANPFIKYINPQILYNLGLGNITKHINNPQFLEDIELYAQGYKDDTSSIPAVVEDFIRHYPEHATRISIDDVAEEGRIFIGTNKNAFKNLDVFSLNNEKKYGHPLYVTLYAGGQLNLFRKIEVDGYYVYEKLTLKGYRGALEAQGSTTRTNSIFLENNPGEVKLGLTRSSYLTADIKSEEARIMRNARLQQSAEDGRLAPLKRPDMNQAMQDFLTAIELKDGVNFREVSLNYILNDPNIPNGFYKRLAKSMLNSGYQSNPNFKIKIDNNLKTKDGQVAKGKIVGDTIYINMDAITYGVDKNTAASELARVLLHEMVHYFTVGMIEKYESGKLDELTKDQINLIEEISILKQAIQKRFNDATWDSEHLSQSLVEKLTNIGNLSLAEFMAEVRTDAEFSKNLDYNFWNRKAKPEARKTFLQKLGELVGNLLKKIGINLEKQDNIYSLLRSKIDELSQSAQINQVGNSVNEYFSVANEIADSIDSGRMGKTADRTALRDFFSSVRVDIDNKLAELKRRRNIALNERDMDEYDRLVKEVKDLNVLSDKFKKYKKSLGEEGGTSASSIINIARQELLRIERLLSNPEGLSDHKLTSALAHVSFWVRELKTSDTYEDFAKRSPLFSEAEKSLERGGSGSTLDALYITADRLYHKMLHDIYPIKVQQLFEQVTGRPITKEMASSMIQKQVSTIEARVRSIDKLGLPLADLLSNITETIEMSANDKISEKWEEINKLSQDITDREIKMFFQSYKGKRLPKLATLFSEEFQLKSEANWRVLNDFIFKSNSKGGVLYRDKVAAKMKEILESEDILDFTKLIDLHAISNRPLSEFKFGNVKVFFDGVADTTTEEGKKNFEREREEYLKKVKENLRGSADVHIEKVIEKAHGFMMAFEEEFNDINELDVSLSEKNQRMNKWLADNSPFTLSSQINLFLKENTHYTGSWEALFKKVKTDQIKHLNKKEEYRFGMRAVDRYAVRVPRRYDSKGNLNKNAFNEEYESIIASPKLKAFYDFILDLFQEYELTLSEKEFGRIKGHQFIHIDQERGEQLISLFKNKSMEEVFAAIREAYMMEKGGQNRGFLRNYVSGTDYFTSKLNINLHEKQIEKELEIRQRDYENSKEEEFYKMKNPETTYEQFMEKTKEEINRLTPQWRAEILSKISEDISFNLPAILKYMFAEIAMHREQLAKQESINMLYTVFDNTVMNTKTPSGDNVYAGHRSRDVKKNVHAMQTAKEAVEHHIKSFFGVPTNEKRLTGSKTVYTSQQRREIQSLETTIKIKMRKKAELEDKLAKMSGAPEQEIKDVEQSIMILNEEMDSLNKKIASIGSVVDNDAFVDTAFKFIHWKAMAYNMTGAFTNVIQGTISNNILAAEGRVINKKLLNQAYRLMGASVLRNFSFHAVDRFSPAAKRIRAILDSTNIIQDLSSELYKARNDESTRSHFMRVLDGYQATKRVEYMNQGAVIIAMMLKENLQDYVSEEFKEAAKGKTLLDAFNQDGKWDSKFGPKPKEAYNNFLTKASTVLRETHGNYSQLHTILAKKNIYGRAAFMFRTWFVEAWYKRFQKDFRYNYAINYGSKGRFSSIGDLRRMNRSDNYNSMTLDEQRADDRAALFKTLRQFGKMVAQDYGSVLRISKVTPFDVQEMLNSGIGKLNLSQELELSDTDILDLQKYLNGEELTPDRKEFIEKTALPLVTEFLEVAKGNILGAVREIRWATFLLAAAIGIGLLAGDDDKEVGLRILYSLLMRSYNDLGIYTNPSSFAGFAKSPFAMLTTVEESVRLLNAGWDTLTGEGTYETGIYSGRSKLLVTGGKFLPGPLREYYKAEYMASKKPF